MGINHDVDFLRVEPGLRVLVSIALDADMFVYNHYLNWKISAESIELLIGVLTMTAPLFELVMDRLHLIFSNIIVNVQVLLFSWLKV
jgi:cytochrome c oxidase subunit IV